MVRLLDNKMTKLYNILIVCLVATLSVACGNKPTQQKGATITAAPFSADSAYHYVKTQVDFGPRVPGSQAHHECAQWLQNELTRHGATVSIQQGQLPNYAGDEQPICNIIGQFNPERKNRVLLCAHWDSRPWADQEEDYDARFEAIDGANDGASGVGVLLEIARQLGIQQTTKGIDIVFFDVEDMGTPEFYTGPQREDTWCLGSQLWAKEYLSSRREEKEMKNTVAAPSSPQWGGVRGANYQYAILLDMVGAPDAIFPKEYYSMQYASNYVEKVWRTAAELGYAHYFSQQQTYPITDDHYYVNTIAGIPCLDIIHYNPNTSTGFAPWWHTHEDDMRNISPHTLAAVGTVVLTAIQ